MTRRRLTALGAALLLLSTGIVAERRYAATQSAALAAAQAHIKRLDGMVRHEQFALTALQQAEADAQREAAAARAAAIAAESASAMKLWATRIAILKRLLAEMPAQALPEIRLLGPLDWVEAVRKHELESAESIRTAFAVVRGSARGKFAKCLQEALRAFTAASGGALPGDISHLAAYLTPPADREMLQRYTLLRAGRLGEETEPLIRELASSDMILTVSLNSWKMVVNNDRPPEDGNETATVNRLLPVLAQTLQGHGFDEAQANAFFGAFLGNGSSDQGSSQGLAINLGQVVERLDNDGFTTDLKAAAQRYRAQHEGAWPTSLADLHPYMPTALRVASAFRPVIAELEYILDHEGARPTSPEQLERYLQKPIQPDQLLRQITLKINDEGLELNVAISTEKPAEPQK